VGKRIGDPVAEGRRKQQGRSIDGLIVLELEEREEGVRCTQQGRDAAQKFNNCTHS
jgi:hypothetical protein